MLIRLFVSECQIYSNLMVFVSMIDSNQVMSSAANGAIQIDCTPNTTGIAIMASDLSNTPLHIAMTSAAFVLLVE